MPHFVQHLLRMKGKMMDLVGLPNARDPAPVIDLSCVAHLDAVWNAQFRPQALEPVVGVTGAHLSGGDDNYVPFGMRAVRPIGHRGFERERVPLSEDEVFVPADSDNGRLRQDMVGSTFAKIGIRGTVKLQAAPHASSEGVWADDLDWSTLDVDGHRFSPGTATAA